MELLQLYDKNKNKKAGLTEYKDLCIESVLTTGDKKLSFSYSKEAKYYDEIVEEGYIRTKKDEFVIKARDVGVDYTRFDCVLNLETLEANIFDRFESVEQPITASLNLAIVGTGWTVKDNTLKKKRTVRCTNKNALEIVQEIKKTYRVDIVFNTLSKQIEVYEHLGQDKGAYFIDSLNLTALQVQSDSYKFATRIIAEGKDGLTFSSINNGKNYVENYQYSKKVKTLYWKDERYTIKESLLEDAKAKLREISKPYTSYNASVLNLAELNPKYKNILDYRLGDTITLISRNNKVKDKQRIVKILEYPQDHSRDTVELANAVLKFEDIQQENQETTDTVSNITVDNGTIDGSTIDGIKVKQIEDFKANVVEVVNLKAINANIDNLHANKADIQDLHAVTAKIGKLEATKANITQLNAVNAEISKLNAIKANVTDLNAAAGKINVLESKTASIDNLLAGNLTANNFKANSITASSGIIADGAIGDAQISSLNANKMRAGTLDTSLVTVAGPNGRLKILGNKLQIFDDVNNRLFERIMLGINDKNRACLTLRATDGQTVLLTEEGLTKAGITDGFGKADDNSLSALKLDKNSIVRQVNGATETIRGTRVQIGDRTLDVELSTQKNTITGHSKELSNQKATIQALDNAIKLKVDSQTFTQSTTTINNNINKAKEEAINSANSNTTNAINNIQIGGVNLLISNLAKTYPNNVGLGIENKRNDESISYVRILSDSKKHISVFGATIGEILKDKFILNQKYTISCEVRIPTEGYVGFYAGTPVNHVLANKWTKISYTFVGTSNNVRVVGFEYSGTQLDYRNLKLEEGEFATDYSLAPEDVKKYSDDVAKAKSDLAKTEAIANADGKITAEEQKRIVEAKKNLDIAIAKSEKAKADAINTASTDATNKANNALNSAKAFVNSEINTVNTHLNKNTSEINILKGKIESKVSQSDIDKSISNITIGGRNLVKKIIANNNTSLRGDEILLGSNGGDTYFKVDLYEPLITGETYTLSLNASNVGSGVDWQFGIQVQNNKYKIHINKNGRISSTFVAIKTEDMSKILIDDIVGRLGKNNIVLSKFKVEKGNKATDYTEPPEHLNQTIIDNIKTVTDKISTVESKFTQENNSIKASVQDLNSTTQTITTNVSNLNRDLTNKINSNLDVAKNFATDIATNKANAAKQEAISNAKNYTNTEINVVNTKVDNVESGINILKDQIKSKVSQSDIDKSIQNIKLGGRNLYLNTKNINWVNWNNISHWTIDEVVDGFNVFRRYGVWMGVFQGIGLKKDSFYTLSAWVKGDGKSTIYHFASDDFKLISQSFVPGEIAPTEWTRISVTYKALKNTTNKIRFENSTDGATLRLYALKLEEGNKATDWTPAPEDLNQSIADNIKVVNSKISDVSSSVTQLRDSVTTDIRAINSKTQSIETTLNGKASKQEVTEVNNKVTTIKADLSSITQRVATEEVKTNKLNDNIQSLSSRMQSAEQKITPTSIINTVSSTIDTRINAIEIGGRNYILNSNFINLTPGSSAINKWKVWGDISVFGRQGQENYNENGVAYLGALKGGGIWQELSSKLIKKDTEYTLSLLIGQESNVKKSDCYVEYWNGNSKIKTVQIFTFSGGLSLERRSFKFRTITNNFTEIRLVLNHEGASTSSAYLLQVGLIKLEEGKFNTAWTPAPEDVTQEFSEMKANFSVTINGINSEVSKKVNFNEVISRINQSAEGVKINANKIDLNGYVTATDLAGKGTTVINGANIRTGEIFGIAINSCYFEGKNMMYIREGGTFSCDGPVYAKDFYVPKNGKFAVEPEAWFSNTVHAKSFLADGNKVPISIFGNKWVVESFQGVSVPNGNAMQFRMVGGATFYSDLWMSDKKLKENIKNVNEREHSKNKIGLDLIKSINHYSFNYKDDKDNTVECGYISQDLQENNKQLVVAGMQEDGTEILQPRVSTIIPNLSLAIQEQQKIIEKLERRIEELERKAI